MYMHITSYDAIPKNIKLLRIHQRISQEDIAATINLARSTYSSYETGARIPDIQTLCKLSSLYEVNIACLVGCDLSKGLLHWIYFNDENKDFADLLNKYQQLSFESKELISKHLDFLLEHEGSLSLHE